MQKACCIGPSYIPSRIRFTSSHPVTSCRYSIPKFQTPRGFGATYWRYPILRPCQDTTIMHRFLASRHRSHFRALITTNHTSNSSPSYYPPSKPGFVAFESGLLRVFLSFVKTQENCEATLRDLTNFRPLRMMLRPQIKIPCGSMNSSLALPLT